MLSIQLPGLYASMPQNTFQECDFRIIHGVCAFYVQSEIYHVFLIILFPSNEKLGIIILSLMDIVRSKYI